MKIVWMLPRSGYVTEPRSVTLWGTICWGIRYLFGKDELVAFLERCKKDEPDFVISSAFPFKKWEGRRVPFFPNILHLAPDIVLEEVEEALKQYRLGKKLSKIEWLSQPDFEKMLRGELTEQDLLATLLDEVEKKKEHNELRRRGQARGDYRTTNREVLQNAPPKRHDYSMTHNTIDRLRGGTLNLPDAADEPSGQLFHATDTWWSDEYDDQTETGLYFLVDGSEEKVRDVLVPVLRFLEHRGFGADRTAGKGFFKFEIEDFKIAEPDESNALVNLSLFIPKDNDQLAEIDSDGRFLPYKLENREGMGCWSIGDSRKTPTLFFAEGSVFPKLEGGTKRWRGRVLENRTLADGQKVYDYGFGFMLNLNWKKS